MSSISDNRVNISNDNPSIVFDKSRCDECGICKNICKFNVGVYGYSDDDYPCINCGSCTIMCPHKCLSERDEIDKLRNYLHSGKIVVFQIAPAVRVSLGEEFGFKPGTNVEGKIVTALKMIGGKYVFDTTFGADLTVMEEANEFINRFKNNDKLPMFTSCCPAWIKYAEQFYPEILEHISTCKSPIGMMGMIVQNYFTEAKKLDKSNIYTVAITPCTAKKYEINREEIKGTDLVLTLYELEEYIKEQDIKYEDIKSDNFDSLLGEGSGAGVIFGNTGGVMEAALRTAYYLITGTNLEQGKLEFHSVRGYNGLRETNIEIGDLEIKVAIIDGMSNAKKVLEDVKKGKSPYHYIEIMNCVGGCIGGGGQPKINISQEDSIKDKRISGLYNRDNNVEIRFSHENPDIVKVYDNYLEKPLSSLSEKILHTHYIDRSKDNNY